MRLGILQIASYFIPELFHRYRYDVNLSLSDPQIPGGLTHLVGIGLNFGGFPSVSTDSPSFIS